MIEDEDDEDYRPPKRSRREPPSPTAVYDSNGCEIVEPVPSSVSIKSGTGTKKKKTAVSSDTEKESDGESALRDVRAQEDNTGTRHIAEEYRKMSQIN